MHERDAAVVDDVVGQHRHHDLGAQRVLVESRGISRAQFHREVVGQHLLRPVVAVDVRRHQVVGEGDLRPRQKHAEFRGHKAHTAPEPLGDLLVRGQELDGPVQQSAVLQGRHQPLVDRQQPALLEPPVGQQHVLPVVVGQHKMGDVVGH